jgi:hypothetical protein
MTIQSALIVPTGQLDRKIPAKESGDSTFSYYDIRIPGDLDGPNQIRRLTIRTSN